MTSVPHRPAARISIARNINDALIRVHAFEGQATPLWRVPMEIIINGDRVRCQSHRLPLRSCSLGEINIVNALEFAIDDNALLREAQRVLIPGGNVHLVVPNRVGFGVLDTFNGFRYAVDVSGRGPALPEIAETGWRRHYSLDELKSMVRALGFEFLGASAQGLAGAELVNGVRLIKRWLAAKNLASQHTKELDASNVRRTGKPLPTALGARLHVLARKPLESRQ